MKNRILINLLLMIACTLTLEQINAETKTLENPTPQKEVVATPDKTPEVQTPIPQTQPQIKSEEENNNRYGFHVALGLPQPWMAGLDLSLHNTWSFALDYGSFSLTSGLASVKMDNMGVRGRWHPWSGSFFLGLGLGNQNLTGEATDNVALLGTNYRTTVKLEVKSMIVTPHIGWLWLWDSGFMMGMDLGVQVPLNSSSTFSATADGISTSLLENLDDYIKLKDDAEKLGNTVGKMTFPYITLLKLGWMF